jgi:hypothetical protein
VQQVLRAKGRRELINLNWNKCQGEIWCPLDTVNLEHEHFDNMEGVYIIWHAGQNPRTVRVGQGIIRDRLKAHREDPEVQAYSQYGLYVTWARVEARNRDGVEAYLASTLSPLVGERFLDTSHVAVNLPW